MFFENLAVARIIVHEIHRRQDDKQAVPPLYGPQPLTLSPEAMDFLRERVVTAMGSNSQSMEMAISTPLPGCAVEIAQNLMMSATDAEFVTHSRRYADRLTAVQTSRGLPGGMLVVFKGTAGNPARNIVGVIKAETHSGFRARQNLQVEYLKDLFMGPQTKLYKMAIFSYDGQVPMPALPIGWNATVHDSQMTGTRRDGAAAYFYESFLGCALPHNSAQLTKRFYEGTREFINRLDIEDDEKSELLTGLYTYLKVDQSSTVELADFSNKYFKSGLQDDYSLFMAAKEFPTNAVPKDISEIQGYLRRRKLSFSRQIQLTAPPDAFEDLVTVKSIDGEPDVDGVLPKWTQITVRDRIREQE